MNRQDNKIFVFIFSFISDLIFIHSMLLLKLYNSRAQDHLYEIQLILLYDIKAISGEPFLVVLDLLSQNTP